MAPQRAATSILAGAPPAPATPPAEAPERSPTPELTGPITAESLPTVKQQERVQVGTLHEDVGEAGLRFDAAMRDIIDATNPIKEEAADLMPCSESRALTVQFEIGKGSREEVTPVVRPGRRQIAVCGSALGHAG